MIRKRFKNLVNSLNFLKKRKEKKREHSYKEELKAKTLNKISHLRKGKDHEKALKFFEIIRDFFKNYYKIKYEFTYRELIKELESKKIKNKDQIINFFSTVMDTRFKKNMTDKETDELIRTIKEFISKLQ